MIDGGQKPSNLELYLDGRVAVAELRAFEEQMSRDPQLRAMVSAQGQIDSSLRRVMAAPSAPAVTPATYSLKPSLLWRIRRSRWVAIAAVLIIGVSGWGVWGVFFFRPPPQAPFPPPRRPPPNGTEFHAGKNRRICAEWGVSK